MMTHAIENEPPILEKQKLSYQPRLRQFTAELQLLRRDRGTDPANPMTVVSIRLCVCTQHHRALKDIIKLRSDVSAEAARCATLELSLGKARREVAAAQAEASAAAAAGAHAAAERAKEREGAAKLHMQLDVAERERTTLREHVRALEVRCASTEREREEHRGRQEMLAAAQRAAQDSQVRAQQVAEHAQRSVCRLESELRRVAHSAEAGVALRERARLAAAAHRHARERADTTQEHDRRLLKNATEEINMLRLRVKELENASSKPETSCVNTSVAEWAGTVAELRAQLAAERAGYERVAASLAAAVKDNAQHARDHDDANTLRQPPAPAMAKPNTLLAVEQFLEE